MIVLYRKIASLDRVIAVAKQVGLKEEASTLDNCRSQIRDLSAALTSPIDRYPDSRFNEESVKTAVMDSKIVSGFKKVLATIKAKFPEATPEQNAWDILTRLEENLKVFENAKTKLASAVVMDKRGKILYHSFLYARDMVLTSLYDSIGNRFAELYRGLHGADEAGFTAKIEPEDAGLDLEVDFYGRGNHPPHALHSEGHQDSMGLCLFLALAERLTGGFIDLVILDDVIMSVDSDHRREICRLLRDKFPNRQFIITTHDKTWANQLKTEGIVQSSRLIEFYNWHVDTGPCVDCETDMWEQIDKDLKNNDVPSAAARLRRGSEHFFSTACDALQAHVVFKINGRWELGDLLPAAMRRYRELLKQAKNVAQSWNAPEILKELDSIDQVAGKIYSHTNAEQWAINASVHYNNWAKLSPKDFSPTLQAFKELYGLFVCDSCQSMLYLNSVGPTPSAVRCACGKINWNLTAKPKGK